MTTPIVQSITDEQLQELEDAAPHAAALCTLSGHMLAGLIARLRAAEKDPWQAMESCPLHQDVLFYHSRDGVYSGIKTCADTFLDDKERDEWAHGEDAQWKIDCWYYGPRGVDRLEGSEVPHAWMPMPEHKDMQP